MLAVEQSNRSNEKLYSQQNTLENFLVSSKKLVHDQAHLIHYNNLI